jgi:hypothetical protein
VAYYPLRETSGVTDIFGQVLLIGWSRTPESVISRGTSVLVSIHQLVPVFATYPLLVFFLELHNPLLGQSQNDGDYTSYEITPHCLVGVELRIIGWAL